MQTYTRVTLVGKTHSVYIQILLCTRNIPLCLYTASIYIPSAILRSLRPARRRSRIWIMADGCVLNKRKRGHELVAERAVCRVRTLSPEVENAIRHVWNSLTEMLHRLDVEYRQDAAIVNGVTLSMEARRVRHAKTLYQSSLVIPHMLYSGPRSDVVLDVAFFLNGVNMISGRVGFAAVQPLTLEQVVDAIGLHKI